MPKSKDRMAPAIKQDKSLNFKKLFEVSSWDKIQAGIPQGWRLTEASFSKGKAHVLNLEHRSDPDLEMMIYYHKNSPKWR